MFRFPPPSFAVLLILAVLGSNAHAAGADWHRDIDEALAQAAKEKKLVVMDVYADWCGPCRMMDEQTFSNERVLKRLEDFVPIKVDADVNTKVATRYGTGSLPTIVAIMSDGSPILTTPGFHDPDAFLAWLDQAEEKVAALRELESAWEQDPQDVGTALTLAREYLMMSRAKEGLPVLRGIETLASASNDAETRAKFQYTLGLTLLTTDAFDEGVSKFETFTEEFPDDPRIETAKRLMAEGRFLSANALLESDDYDAARARFAAIAEDDRFPDIHAEATRRLGMLEILGRDAPALSIQEWVDSDPVTMDGLGGKVVLIDFFQIICPGCKRAKPEIEALKKKYGEDGLEVVGVAVAFEHESSQRPDAIREYVKTTGYDWPVGIDTELTETFTKYQAMGSPWTVLVDRKGNVRHASFFREEEITRRVEQLLAEAV